MGAMSRRWNQAFSRLALAAVLALVFMPSLGRVVRVVAAQPQQQAQHHDHAGMAGMHHDMAGMHGMRRSPAQQGHGGPAVPAEGDCEYCPILASLSLPGTCVFAVPALAWPGGDEKEVGRLAPGLRADFVVLKDDPFALPESELDDLGIVSTWVNGKAVFEAAE